VKVGLYEGAGLTELLQICFALPEDERDQFEAFTGARFDPEMLAASLSLRPGPKWVVAADGHPIFAAGFTELRPGVWQDWAVSTPAAWEAHWRPVTRCAKRVMDEMLQTRAHRLQCVSLASRHLAHRWYGAIGLIDEGHLHGYGVNGEDAVMFYRLRPS
jgi:hypothetical protein